MFQELIIPDNVSLDKFLRELNFDLYLTKPQLKHLQSIINAMMTTGFNGKMSQVSQTDSTKHRTSVSRFMSSSSWDKSFLQRCLRDFVLDIIWSKWIFLNIKDIEINNSPLISKFRNFLKNVAKLSLLNLTFSMILL